MIGTLLAAAAQRLASLTDASPRLEAELLLSQVLDKPRSYLFAWPDRTLSAAQREAFETLLSRRLAGEPVAYITGHREFWSLDLLVTPAVLIPRPDTERLVELALAALPARVGARVADLGTGSGAIAAALAHERPDWEVHATDLSAAALAVARNNFRRLGLSQVRTEQGTWCAALPADRRFDLLVSNPPYVPSGDPHLRRGDLRREPRGALASGADGLDDVRRIAQQAPAHLKTGGFLLLEHGYDQGAAVRQILAERGYTEIATHRDLAGQERVSGGCRRRGE